MKRLPADLSPAAVAQLTARDIMTPDPVTIEPRTPLSDVVALMEGKGIQHFPVVEDGRVTGMISERHLRDAMPSVLTVEDPEARRKFLRVSHASQVAQKNPATVSATARVASVIATMRTHRAGAVGVLEAGQLVGIVSSGDLITLLEGVLARAATV